MPGLVVLCPSQRTHQQARPEVSKKEERSIGAKMTENTGKALKLDAADFEDVRLGYQRRRAA
jgi:hypothetical protein